METKTISELRKEASAIYSEIRKIEQAEYEKEAQKALGKYFTKPNSYGSGPKWLMYFNPVAVETCYLKGLLFQTDCFGRLEVEPNCVRNIDIEGWTEITREEFEDAYRELASTILHLAANE